MNELLESMLTKAVFTAERYTMNRMQEQVMEWHRSFGVPIGMSPSLLSLERMKLRAKLIDEESSETVAAFGYAICDTVDCVRKDDPDLINIMDGMGDTLYVIFGAAIEMGIDLQTVFDEVHRSNMSKMWTVEEWGNAIFEGRNIKEGLTADDMDINSIRCLSVKRADGKIIKSPSYSPVDLHAAIFNAKV